jgi:hypothetical protein
MSEDKRQQITEKVAKMLRQAESVAGTPEEGVFQARAFELLAKYGIDITAVQAKRVGLDLPPEAIRWETFMKGKYEHAQMLLLTNIARSLHCSCIYTTNKIKQVVVTVFGMPHHIERVQMLWSLLQPQVLRQVAALSAPMGSNTMRYRRAYIAGFASEVGTRLREQETKAVESAGGGALVLYRSDTERAEMALRRVHPRTRSARPAGFDYSGYRHGQRDGRSAEMQHGIK